MGPRIPFSNASPRFSDSISLNKMSMVGVDKYNGQWVDVFTAHVACRNIEGRAKIPTLLLAGDKSFYLQGKFLSSVEMLEAVFY